MKKQLSIAMSLMMGVSILSGCGNNADSAGSSSTTSSMVKSTTEASKEAVTIRFVTWQTNHEKANQAVADAYHELHPNVTIQFDYIGDMNSKDYLTKTDVMLMGDETMDIIMAPSFADYATRASAGSYLDLDPYFKTEGTTFEDEYNVTLRINDGAYGIPTDMKYNLVLINKDMLDAAGLETPSLDWTWDDYREYAKKLTSGNSADTTYGSYFHSWGSVRLYGIESAKSGSEYFNDDKTLTFDNEYNKKFLQLIYDMENVDKSSTPLADIKSLNMNYRDQFFSGNIAMLPMGTFMLSDIGNEKYEHNFVTTFARMPVWSSDDPHYNTASATVFSLARTSEHPQEAYDFLRFWSTEGVTIKGMFIANTKGADKMESVTKIISGFEDKVDVEALSAIMRDDKWVDSYSTYIPDFQSELDSINAEETDKFLLGSQDLDTTIHNLMDRGNAVIAENSN